MLPQSSTSPTPRISLGKFEKFQAVLQLQYAMNHAGTEIKQFLKVGA
jgi:hypothetical protein